MKTFMKNRRQIGKFEDIVGFTSDLKEFWCSFVRLKLEIRYVNLPLFSLTLKICFCWRFNHI